MTSRRLTPETRFTQPGFLLNKVGFVARRWIADALAPLGLNGREAEILLRLRATGPLSQRQLIDQLAVDPSNLVTMLNRLEAAGLLERTRDAADRRRHIVSITAAGRAKRDAVDAAVRSAEERLLSGLTGPERTTLQRLLLKVDERTGPAWADED
ncbi:MAG TPA: MarR family winged helix-turn-helix transcriptional regulator [Baekduia sp.]|uniref:MarR family winged helix-turn-helix transcriptional regulator n=1 Tax=Baekduia sp. TaxID=2600305 RepID=UPI002D771EF2|nr:MarR family winged helix-turn-helix transcriptional regulator [Baekduia sp.]HET6510156.1 MarR family winged helix-turn-helix transcriptional regulator [Baekduia sp.]